MNPRRTLVGLGIALLPGAACSQASLPPGTPPPEYEMRPVDPWPPASAAALEAPPAESAPVPPPASPPADGLSDAGVSDPPDAATDAASSTGAL